MTDVDETKRRAVQKRLIWTSEREAQRLERGLPFLATTGSSAPFIGLFGTVIGIIQAFQGIAEAGSASLAVVAPGIAEALVATAAGLLAAIPATIFYNNFVARADNINTSIQLFREEFDIDLSRMGSGGSRPHSGGVDPRAPSARAAR
jgi:biopolymer transport protein TolQ